MSSPLKRIGWSYGFATLGFLVLCLRLGFPYHRFIAIAIYILSIGFFVFAIRKTNWLTQSKDRLSQLLSGKLSKCFYTLGTVTFIYLLWVLVPLEKSPLLELSETELHQHISDDLQTILMLNENMKAAYQALSESTLFEKDISNIQPEDIETLKTHWHAFVTSTLELDVLKEKYKGFSQINQRTQPELHAKSFGIAFGAYVAQYRGNLFLGKLVNHNAYIETLFNEADPKNGIPANTYYRLSQHTTHPHTLIRYNAGRAYYKLVKDDIEGHEAAKQELEDAIAHIQGSLLKEPTRFIDNPLDRFEKLAFKAWIPLQKGVALTLADIRLTDQEHLISRELIASYRNKLQPGDILLERRNWYATNIGIPGFWPHAALYIGDLSKMDSYFTGIQLLEDKKASQFIKETYPDIYKAMQTPDESGDVYCIIEAIKPGVVLNTLETSGHADSLGVLRPRIDKETKFKAILQALAHHGKPYDYNFEFATNSALVCSELVYKAYYGLPGITLNTVIMNGRNLLPPNMIAQKFDEEYGTEAQELDLVLFLDAEESEGTAVEKDVEAFRESWKRPKWYILANTMN